MQQFKIMHFVSAVINEKVNVEIVACSKAPWDWSENTFSTHCYFSCSIYSKAKMKSYSINTISPVAYMLITLALARLAVTSCIPYLCIWLFKGSRKQFLIL